MIGACKTKDRANVMVACSYFTMPIIGNWLHFPNVDIGNPNIGIGHFPNINIGESGAIPILGLIYLVKSSASASLGYYYKIDCA